MFKYNIWQKLLHLVEIQVMLEGKLLFSYCPSKSDVTFKIIIS
jgi:hypothetical protein